MSKEKKAVNLNSWEVAKNQTRTGMLKYANTPVRRTAKLHRLAQMAPGPLFLWREGQMTMMVLVLVAYRIERKAHQFSMFWRLQTRWQG